MAPHASAALSSAIVGHTEAFASIESSLLALQAGLADGSQRSTSFAFVGPTGVGKSASASLLASSLVRGGGVWPLGRDAASYVLTLRGEHFSASSAAAEVAAGRFMRALAAHLLDTDGRGVVVVDEAQKMAPGVLSQLAPFLDAGADAVTVPIDGEPHRITVRQLVVIVISDIGVGDLKALLAKGASGAAIQAGLRGALLSQLTAVDAPLAGRFHRIVPFAPLSPIVAHGILQQHLEKLEARWRLPLAAGGAHALQQPATLSIAPDVAAAMLTLVRFGKFNSQDAAGAPLSVVFSVYGARSVHEHDEGPLRRVSSLLDSQRAALKDALVAQLQRAGDGAAGGAAVDVRLEVEWDNTAPSVGDLGAPSGAVSAETWLNFLRSAVGGRLRLRAFVALGADQRVGADGAVSPAFAPLPKCTVVWQGSAGDVGAH